jgi:hypothetical protein
VGALVHQFHAAILGDSLHFQPPEGASCYCGWECVVLLSAMVVASQSSLSTQPSSGHPHFGFCFLHPTMAEAF